MPDVSVGVLPAVLLAQGGGHGHVLDVGVDIGPTVLRMALLVAVPVVVAFALLRGFLAEPSRRALTAVLMAAATGVTLELLLSGGLSFSARLVPLVLALLAVPLYLARSRDPRFARAVGLARRYAPWIFWPAAVLAVMLFAQARFADVAPARASVLLHSGVVLALVALAWFAVVRTRRAPGTVGARLGAGVLAILLMAAAAQATVLRPAEPVPGVAVVGTVGGADVLVVPNLPGWNLVRVDGEDASVGTSEASLVAATARPGATGSWAAVELPSGPAEVLVRHRGGTGSVTVDTGAGDPAPPSLAGADGAECASALLARAVATDGQAPATIRCPADALAPADVVVLRHAVDVLAAQGHQWIAVFADDSPRGLAADRVVRAAAARSGVEVRSPGAGPLVVVSGWTGAAETVRLYPDADVHAAPWLVTSPRLAPGLEAMPEADGTSAYRNGLQVRYPGVPPSVSGYRAWFAERADASPTDLADGGR